MGVITIRNLHTVGRAGNQLFLYAFAKGYALAHGCELQVPKEWWGRRLFYIEDPPLKAILPQTELDSKSKKPIGYFFGRTNIDIFAYAQHQAYLDFYTRADVKKWFRIRPEFEQPSFEHSGPYTACHIRRGDYVEHPLFRQRYAAVSVSSYHRALSHIKHHEPMVMVREGWQIPPIAMTECGFAWVPDFLTLRNADVLLRANSSFSVWAGWLGNGRVYSPLVENKVGLQDVDFVEGNHANTAGVFPNQSTLHLNEK